MMKNSTKGSLGIEEALKTYGGFVRFYAADVPVEDVAAMAPKRGFSRVLCCCEGGDFALTFMGLGKPGTEVFAFDTCPAQLFLLAAKAKLIKVSPTRHFSPSLDMISRLYEGHLRPLPRVISKLGIHAKLIRLKTGKVVNLPEKTAETIGVDIFPGNDAGRTRVSWGQNQEFLSAIRRNVPSLRLIHEDIFLLDGLFEPNSLDVIFISDIHIPAIIPYYLKRLKLLISRLKKGGVVIGDADCGGDLDNVPTIIEILAHESKAFGLRPYGRKGAVMALQKQ